MKKQGINIEYVVFNDYVQPDVALKEGKIDMHSCLTRYYFESYDKEQNAHLTSIGNTVISPLGVYSHKYQKFKIFRKEQRSQFLVNPQRLNEG
ncbi:methionine ABC transporter substrate-binding protein [Limosilactobacillus reuteri]|uniref:Methionine ABC transporter substrate-binding protein n=1 Tax=Limosilactobacillus reuteri TaxID=1598 RepID=A0A2S1ERN9_LIMRT|nr:methionine ABC transporter substrate-binding protein [Limosilactobacillus reuteri]